MTTITTIGLDLAKKVFQVHGVDAEGKIVVARKLKRKEVLAFFAKLPPCLVGMEACGSAHYWAREITKLGHTVKLMPPKYVKPYVKRGKTDAIDAEAICEAVARPSMSFVPVKGVEQQGLSMLHGARSQLIGQRTQLINAVRGHLSEFGIVAERGLLGLAELAAIVRDESDQRIARDSTRITDDPCSADRDDQFRDLLSRQFTEEGEQGERSGSAARDDPLGWSGDRQCDEGASHRR